MHDVYVGHGVFQSITHSLHKYSSAAVPSGAAQTDITAAIVGGVTVAVVLIVAMTIIVVVVLLRLRCGPPARTPVQYVHTVQV